MPTFRFTRFARTGVGEIIARDIAAAKQLLASDKSMIVAGRTFEYTQIEEVASNGYKETTTADLIGDQAAPTGVIAKAVEAPPTFVQRVRRVVGL